MPQNASHLSYRAEVSSSTRSFQSEKEPNMNQVGRQYTC